MRLEWFGPHDGATLFGACAKEGHRARHLLEDVGPVLGAHHRSGHLEDVALTEQLAGDVEGEPGGGRSFTVTG